MSVKLRPNGVDLQTAASRVGDRPHSVDSLFFVGDPVAGFALYILLADPEVTCHTQLIAALLWTLFHVAALVQAQRGRYYSRVFFVSLLLCTAYLVFTATFLCDTSGMLDILWIRYLPFLPWDVLRCFPLAKSVLHTLSYCTASSRPRDAIQTTPHDEMPTDATWKAPGKHSNGIA